MMCDAGEAFLCTFGLLQYVGRLGVRTHYVMLSDEAASISSEHYMYTALYQPDTLDTHTMT
jgi:hypothetical protein